MKKLISVLLILIIIFSVSACEKNTSNTDLMLILENKQQFITEAGEKVYIKDYKYGEEYYATLNKYTSVDFDDDGIDELVVDISVNGGIYLVLHSDSSKVYGFLFSARELQSLKTDGSFMQSGGAIAICYCSMTFGEGTYEITEIAVSDSYTGRLEIDGKECSVEEINEYAKNWQLKEDAEWFEI